MFPYFIERFIWVFKKKNIQMSPFSLMKGDLIKPIKARWASRRVVAPLKSTKAGKIFQMLTSTSGESIIVISKPSITCTEVFIQLFVFRTGSNGVTSSVDLSLLRHRVLEFLPPLWGQRVTGRAGPAGT